MATVLSQHDAKDPALRLQLHPMQPWLLRVSPHQLACLSTALAEHTVFAYDAAEELLDGCFFDGDALEAFSLLPPALVCDCALALVVGVSANALVAVNAHSAARLAHQPLPASVQLSGPCLPLSCIHILAGTAQGNILALDVRTGASSSFTGASKVHFAPVTSLVAVPGKASSQLHRAKVVSSCSKGVVAVWDVLCATPLAQIGVTVLASLNTRVVELRYDAFLGALVASTQGAGGAMKMWQGDDLAPSAVADAAPKHSFGAQVQTTRGLPGLPVDGLLTCIDNQLVVRAPPFAAPVVVHEGASLFVQHAYQLDCFAVASAHATSVLRVGGLVPGACLGAGDRVFFLRGLAVLAIAAATTTRPSAARVVVTLPARAAGTGSCALSLRGDVLVCSWGDAFALVNVGGATARVLDSGPGSAHWLSAGTVVMHDGRNLAFKKVSPLEAIGLIKADHIAAVLSASPRDVLLGTLASDKTLARMFKADTAAAVGAAFAAPLAHAWNGTGRLLALHYAGDMCHVVDCDELRVLAQVHFGMEPVQSLCFHLDLTLIAATHNEVRLAFVSAGTVDSYVLAARGHRGVPGFIPTIDRGRRASLHVISAEQDEGKEDAAFSPSPALLRPWDALVTGKAAVPPPVARSASAALVLVGVVDARVFFVADGKLDRVALEHPVLLMGLLACAKFPHRALDWAASLEAGAARDDVVVLLERLGYFEAAALVPGASPLLVLDVCIKHNLADCARRMFASKGMLESLAEAHPPSAKIGLSGVKRLALLLLQNGMAPALKDVLPRLKGDDHRFATAVLGLPLAADVAAAIIDDSGSSPLAVMLARLAMAEV